MYQWLKRQYAKRVVNINVNITIASLAAIAGTVVVVHFSRYLGVDDSHTTLIVVITLVSDWLIDLFVAVTLHWLANHWPRRWQRSHDLIDKYEEVIDAAPPPSLSMIKDAAANVLTPQMPNLSELPHFLQHGPQRLSQPTEANNSASPQTFSATPPAPAAPRSRPKAKPEVSFVRDATTIQLQRLCLSPLFYIIVAVGQWFLLHAGIERELTVILPFFVAIVITRVIHTWWMIHADPIVLEEWEASKRRRHAERHGRATLQGSPPIAATPSAQASAQNGMNHAESTPAGTVRPGESVAPRGERSISRSE